MHINLILIPFVIILGLLFSQSDRKKTRLLYIIICSVVMLIIASMRSPLWMTNTYGIDTLNYQYHFMNTIDMSWNEIWAVAYARYFGSGGDFDIGYIVFSKIVGYFTHDFAVFSLIADLLFFVPFSILLYRYGSSMSCIIFAFVYYVALIQIYLLGGGRQMFAIGLILLALITIIDRKLLKAAFFFLVSVSFHSSAFLFMVPLIMVWYNASPKTLKVLHLLSFFLLPLTLLIPDQVIAFMGEAAGSEKYAEYGKQAINGSGVLFVVLMEALSFCCLIGIKKKHMLQNKKLSVFYTMLPFVTFFTPLIRANGTMIRIALYYSIFLSLLVPFCIECNLRSVNRTMGYIISIGALSILALARGGLIYYFYWQ